ncbi:hypothetical protein K3495_g1278 [Podosphaera aphanis]|nr:hypothetical protein K3495_g1278 [Podosphaera aphanis]
MFIPRFSELVAPLTALTGKGTPFQWGAEQKEAFEVLKVLPIRAPILTQWDHEKATFPEADCSGYALGGTLTQSNGRGQRKAVAFHSQKLNLAERNYSIHDKEMLEIIKCLEQWDAELRSCPEFTILTDHRNLQYFMTRQKFRDSTAALNNIQSANRWKHGTVESRSLGLPQGICRIHAKELGKMVILCPSRLKQQAKFHKGLSLFFITHGYHLSPIEIVQTHNPAHSEEKRAESYLSRLQKIQEFSQSAMAAAQQQQEFHANSERSASESYRVGDRVWLSYEHYESDRPKKKMDWLRGKYTVSKVLGSHNVELAGLPRSISNVFHVDQHRRASGDPLPAQELHDEQPPPITIIDGEEEQFVDEILCARTIKRGNGSRILVLVTWK